MKMMMATRPEEAEKDRGGIAPSRDEWEQSGKFDSFQLRKKS